MVRRLRSAFGQQSLSWIAVGAIWFGASYGGLVMLTMYANSPGPSHQAPRRWPVTSSIRLSDRGATLILFAHPRCPCTRASLGELEKIAARFPDSVTLWVVFFKPTEFEDSWDQTDLRRTAEAIPAVRVASDMDGDEAHRFNATTSGQVLLYNDQGELLYSGGITLARGHAGDNAGRSAIESYLMGNLPISRQSPVFGCPIAVAPQQTQATTDVN